MKEKYQNRILQAESLLEQGYHLQMAGQLDRAASLYRRSIACNPTAMAYTYLGWIFSLKGHPEQAIEKCRRAIELDPTLGNPYNDIGAYLIQQKRYKQAVPWLEAALRAPNYENYCYPYYNLGKISELLADWYRALEYYEQALSENSRYEPARTAIDKLRGKFN